MNELKDFIKDFFKTEKDWTFKDDKELAEFLCFELDGIHTEELGSRRWWNDIQVIHKIGDRYFSISSARTTGDDSPYDVGFEPDISTLKEVKPVTETITITKYADISL